MKKHIKIIAENLIEFISATAAEGAVFMRIAGWSINKNGCKESNAAIGIKIGRSTKTVSRAIINLERKGLVGVTRLNGCSSLKQQSIGSYLDNHQLVVVYNENNKPSGKIIHQSCCDLNQIYYSEPLNIPICQESALSRLDVNPGHFDPTQDRLDVNPGHFDPYPGHFDPLYNIYNKPITTTTKPSSNFDPVEFQSVVSFQQVDGESSQPKTELLQINKTQNSSIQYNCPFGKTETIQPVDKKPEGTKAMIFDINAQPRQTDTRPKIHISQLTFTPVYQEKAKLTLKNCGVLFPEQSSPLLTYIGRMYTQWLNRRLDDLAKPGCKWPAERVESQWLNDFSNWVAGECSHTGGRAAMERFIQSAAMTADWVPDEVELAYNCQFLDLSWMTHGVKQGLLNSFRRYWMTKQQYTTKTNAQWLDAWVAYLVKQKSIMDHGALVPINYNVSHTPSTPVNHPQHPGQSLATGSQEEVYRQEVTKAISHCDPRYINPNSTAEKISAKFASYGEQQYEVQQINYCKRLNGLI